MKIKTWQILLIGILIFIIGFVQIRIQDEYLIPEILIIFGIEIVILGLIREVNLKYKSLKILGLTILILSILNFIRHLDYIPFVLYVLEIFNHEETGKFVIIREIIWLLFSIWLVIKGFNLIRGIPEFKFKEYIKSKEFKLISIGILILFMMEIPVFGIHGDFIGGLHGHNFWDMGFHFH